MVTSNKINDKKVVKMSEPSGAVVIPQRTLLGEVNEHITCPLCRGYYIDATTIVECLHSFCRSCIINHLQVKSYCPVCEMMINSAKPNIKLDKALQDIVYKLVPGLFQKEMERRQHFYASRPGPAASATPEQRGEDTERIIFSPEDVISFSLEYADVTDTDSVSSKSSDSNESQPTSTITRRFLQCPAVVNISHLKKFLSMKFDIDSTQFAIDILYKRVPLPDYYTLMDIAYIYNWKRNEPMRFFYQIIDYVALRHRFFDVNRKDTHFRDRKSSPVPTEESNVISPTQNVTDQGSEVSSGVDSPMPGDNNHKKTNDNIKKSDNDSLESKESSHNTNERNKNECATSKKDEDVEKSQFLNSFELTAKNNCTTLKSSPSKSNLTESKSSPSKSIDSSTKPHVVPKIEESLKRKQSLSNVPEMKKLKIELEKTKLPIVPIKQENIESSVTSKEKSNEKPKEELDLNAQKKLPTISTNSPMSTAFATKETKSPTPALKQILTSDTLHSKRISSTPENITSPKKKLCSDNAVSGQQHVINQKLMTPIKTPVSKVETQLPLPKAIDTPKPSAKRLPDLKPSAPPSQTSHNKTQPVNKVRMDLLANNSDPTIDRSKILTQVKSALPLPSASTVQGSGDPLKSLFDSCKINIPSSLSITLTEQKLDQQTPSDPTSNDPKKCVTSKSSVSNTNAGTHKLPNPPVHNYIEILKLPDTDNTTKSDTPATNSSKGPVPNLKPISDTKIGKQSGHFAGPITFQQTFEQQVQSMQSDKKTKVGRTNKLALPKLVPATPKAISVANKLNNLNNKPNVSGVPPNEIKSTAALDLSTPHNVQTRKLETMQSIANLAKQQSFAPKSLPLSQGVSQSNLYSTMSNRLMSNTGNALRVPTPNLNQIKASPNISQPTLRPEAPNKTNAMKSGNTVRPTIPSPCSTYSHPSPNATLPSPRSQTRSPSSSPKLVIAEEKQMGNMFLESSVKQTNQGTSAQFSSSNANKESKASSGPSKPTSKPVKQTSSSSGKSPIQTSSLMQTLKPNPPLNSAADFLLQSPFITHHAFMSQQMDSIQNVWLKARNMGFLKNMSQQSQDDYRKDKS